MKKHTLKQKKNVCQRLQTPLTAGLLPSSWDLKRCSLKLLDERGGEKRRGVGADLGCFGQSRFFIRAYKGIDPEENMICLGQYFCLFGG